MVHIPTLEQERRRAWPRQRKQLQGQRLSLASQGRSLVLTQGVAIDNLWWQPARWKRHQDTLASWLMEHLEVFRRIILALDEEIDQIDKKILAQRKVQAQPRPKYAGEGSLEVIEAEVCDWNRFWLLAQSGELLRLNRRGQCLRASPL